MDYESNIIAFEIAEFLNGNDDFLITSHYSPDGDNIGASTSLYVLLREMGKEVVFINRDKYPEKYNFIKPKNMKFYQREDFQKKHKFSNIITIDTADYHRIGEVSELIEQDAFIINIDHHYTNTMYGNLNFVLSDLASACEVLYLLLKETCIKINTEIAYCLYAGMLSDTGGFRFKTTKAAELKIASELAEYGIDLSLLMNEIFFYKSHKEVVSYARAISKIKLYPELHTAVLYHDELTDPLTEHDPVMEAMDSIKESKINLYVRNIANGKLRLSLRSKCDFNAAEFLSKYGGGGHKAAAGMFYEGNWDDFKSDFLLLLFDEIDKYLKQST